MISLGGAGAAKGGFDSFVQLQEENLALLRQRADQADNASMPDEARAFIARAVATGALLQRPSERRAAQAAIDYWTTSLILSRGQANEPCEESETSERIGGETPDAPVLADFNPAQGADIGDKPSPYKGLDPFTEDDAPNYFGREDAVAELQRRLEGSSPVVFLLGTSGSGKSSLLNAGLKPRLGSSNVLADYKVLSIASPGRAPIERILRAIDPGAAMSKIQSEERRIARKPAVLNDLLTAAHEKAVLIVDQFGEALSRAEIHPSLNIVGEALASLVGRHKLLICIRENQKLQFETIAGIGEYIKSPENCFSPPAPSMYELRSIVEGPAERAGLRFEDGVVEDLIRSVSGNPDALPLLQFTLKKLWDNKERNEITLAVYRKVGSPREALTATADATYSALSAADQEAVKRVFLKLVAPKGEKEFARNRLSRDTLVFGEDAVAVDRVLKEFESAKLLRRVPSSESDGEDRFEVAHETLIGYWPRLADWLGSARLERETDAKLLATARLWLDSGRDPGYLIAGEALAKLRNYQPSSSDVRQLIDASIGAEEEDRRRHRRWKITAISIFAGLLVLVSGGGIYAWNRSQEATAESESLVLQKRNERLESIQQAVVDGDTQALRAGLRALGLPEDAVNRVKTSPPPVQPDEKAQTDVVLAPAPKPVPVPAAPPLPQPVFDPATGGCFGVMWLGSEANWKLESPITFQAFQKQKPPFDAIVSTQNAISLRADYPTPVDANPAYAMAPLFGMVPGGTPIRIMEKGRSYERPLGTQIWAKVRVPGKVCAKVHIQYAGSDALAGDLSKALATAKFRVASAPEKLEQARGRAEIRYFHKEDAALARELADIVKKQTGKEMELWPLLNFSSSKPVPRGSLEVWINLPES